MVDLGVVVPYPVFLIGCHVLWCRAVSTVNGVRLLVGSHVPMHRSRVFGPGNRLSTEHPS